MAQNKAFYHSVFFIIIQLYQHFKGYFSIISQESIKFLRKNSILVTLYISTKTDIFTIIISQNFSRFFKTIHYYKKRMKILFFILLGDPLHQLRVIKYRKVGIPLVFLHKILENKSFFP